LSYLDKHSSRNRTHQCTSKKVIHGATTFSVYLGWITVAPIANIAALLVALGWDSHNITAICITVAIILIALLLTLINIYIRGDVTYAGVIVWALTGIIYKQLNTWLISYIAGFGIITILIIKILKKTDRLR
jgi:hypothetical protein